MEATDIRRVLLQHLHTDRRFGLRSIPLVVAPASIAQATARTAATINHAPAAPPRPTPATAQSTGKVERLRVLDESQVRGCQKCGLAATRSRTVFGQGHPDARLMFIGEAPGYEEDKQGLAFVGKAGQLLTRMITAMGLSRDEVYICNVIKCRPPGNRDPSADEILACHPYLKEQIEIVEPEVIVALGSPAAKTVLGTTESIGRLRGRFHDVYPSGSAGSGAAVPVMPTYHPAYLLRSPEEKAKTWADLQMVMARLGLPVPDRTRGND